MSTTPASVATAAPRPSVAARLARILDRWLVPVYAALAITYLLIPIAIMILFSFNDPIGKFNYRWNEFSLAAWENPLARPGLPDALRNSLVVATVATLVATILGTLIALALARYRFRGRSATNLFIFVPMATPEIVLGASLLTLFVASRLPPFRHVPLLYPTGFTRS
jgi:spermidine/putrescine transport system permease protein